MARKTATTEVNFTESEQQTRKHELRGLLVWGAIVYTTVENSPYGTYISDEDLEQLVESKPELKQLCSKWNGVVL